MLMTDAELSQQQRVQVETESHCGGRTVKIRVERYEERLGWYTASSVSFPLHDLPLLEQAIAAMRDGDDSQTEKIIPFPAFMLKATA